MIRITEEKAEKIVELLMELEGQNQSHYDHFPRGGLDAKSEEIYEMIAYLEFNGEGDEND